MGKMRPGRLWYVAAILPLIAGILISLHFWDEMTSRVKGMRRVVVPGAIDLDLGAGDHTFYGETDSVVDGVGYHAGSFSVRCSLSDASGAAIPMSAPGSHTTYNMFGYTGESMFSATVPTRGTYHFACDGDRGVIAVGEGFGSALVLFVLSIVGAVMATVITLAVVALIRWKRRPT